MPTCRRLPRHRQPPCGTPCWRGVRVSGALLLLQPEDHVVLLELHRETFGFDLRGMESGYVRAWSYIIPKDCRTNAPNSKLFTGRNLVQPKLIAAKTLTLL